MIAVPRSKKGKSARRSAAGHRTLKDCGIRALGAETTVGWEAGNYSVARPASTVSAGCSVRISRRSKGSGMKSWPWRRRPEPPAGHWDGYTLAPTANSRPSRWKIGQLCPSGGSYGLWEKPAGASRTSWPVISHDWSSWRKSTRNSSGSVRTPKRFPLSEAVTSAVKVARAEGGLVR